MAGPYELYFIRHGVAEERGDAWPDDNKRPLTDEGISRLRKAVRGLARIGVSFDLVLTSPLVRARQTADIVAGGLDPRPSIVNIDSLAPAGSYASVVADLEKHARKNRLALVGHEPMIGEARRAAHRLAPSDRIQKGAVCRIDVDNLPPTGARRPAVVAHAR
jgi:phosphohistidine phosphatase